MEEKIFKGGGFTPISEKEMLVNGSFSWSSALNLFALIKDALECAMDYGSDFIRGFQKGVSGESLFPIGFNKKYMKKGR